MKSPFDWLDKAAYPFASHYLTLPDGAKLHYIDEGDPQHPTLLFVHGTPVWSFVYREFIRQLSPYFRCVAFDHIGFGLSDKPTQYAYTPQQHRQNMAALVEHLHLDNFTLIVHDFGGAIGLDYATQNADKIERLVLFNTWCWSNESDADFEKFKKILGSPLLPFLYKYFNFSPRFLIPQAFGDRSKLTKAIHWQYRAPFANASQRMGALGFAKSLLHDQSHFETIWERRDALREKPALLLWGMKDTFLKPAFIDRFRQMFPYNMLVQFPSAGHFVQEEAPQEAIQAMRQFLGLP